MKVGPNLTKLLRSYIEVPDAVCVPADYVKGFMLDPEAFLRAAFEDGILHTVSIGAVDAYFPIKPHVHEWYIVGLSISAARVNLQCHTCPAVTKATNTVPLEVLDA
jgi:hypothetical protein